MDIVEKPRKHLRLHHLVGLARTSADAWMDDYAPSMGAALAYYTLFSLAPMLVIVIAIAGFIFGDNAARGEIVAQLGGLLGADGAAAVQDLLKSASRPAAGIGASVAGVVALIVGATSVLGELQSDLDRIWRAPTDKTSGGIRGLLRSRMLAFSIILAVGFLLLVSLVISAVLSAAGKYWGARLVGWTTTLQVVNQLVSFGITTALFALIYKVLPRVKVAWYDVWIGATVTALLFIVGKFGIGWYIGAGAISSPFGAAGSVVVILVWVYYSAQIFLFGAEFTWVFAHRHGSRSAIGLPPPPPPTPAAPVVPPPAPPSSM